jgi:hypothetical protein
MVVQFLPLIAMQTQFADKLFVAGRLSWLLRDFFQDDGVGEQAVFFLSPRRGSVLSLCEPSHGSRRGAFFCRFAASCEPWSPDSQPHDDIRRSC